MAQAGYRVSCLRVLAGRPVAWRLEPAIQERAWTSASVGDAVRARNGHEFRQISLRQNWLEPLAMEQRDTRDWTRIALWSTGGRIRRPGRLLGWGPMPCAGTRPKPTVLMDGPFATAVPQFRCVHRAETD